LIQTPIIRQYFLLVSRISKNGHASAHLITAAQRLRKAVDRLKFSAPVTHVYNPLAYAWSGHEQYLQKFGDGPKRVVFLGMNPGPFGMVQTGVPFGEIQAVRDWLGIECAISKPNIEHPKRLVTGFDCARSEISGQRLWGLFADRFGNPSAFFAEHFVLNYCPLAFVEETGRNRTPDKLPAAEQQALFKACDEHLLAAIEALAPEWVIGIGNFAVKRAEHVLADRSLKLGCILHPSPASPAANRDWSAIARRQLEQLGVWK
jgi:single-strand selective monofunctional uracil DNA glycosylase